MSNSKSASCRKSERIARAFHLIAATLCICAFLSNAPAYSASIKARQINVSYAEISISGIIEKADAEQFRSIAAKFPSALVSLSSFGGSTMAGIEIGAMVRSKGYSTWVADNQVCSSSCGLIWLGGINRYKSTSAKIGFHASFIVKQRNKHESGLGNALIGRYITQLGYSENAVIFATLAPPERLNWLTAENSGSADILFFQKNPLEGLSARSDPNFVALFESWKRLDHLQRSLINVPSNPPNSETIVRRDFKIGKNELGLKDGTHSGVDLAAETNSPVFSTADGVISVVETGLNGTATVTIEHGHGIQTLYANVKAISVSLGNAIKRGQLIGLVAKDPQSTSGLLHYEVRIDEQPVDPKPFLQTKSYIDNAR